MGGGSALCAVLSNELLILWQNQRQPALNHPPEDKQQHTIIRLCRFMFGITVNAVQQLREIWGNTDGVKPHIKNTTTYLSKQLKVSSSNFYILHLDIHKNVNIQYRFIIIDTNVKGFCSSTLSKQICCAVCTMKPIHLLYDQFADFTCSYSHKTKIRDRQKRSCCTKITRQALRALQDTFFFIPLVFCRGLTCLFFMTLDASIIAKYQKYKSVNGGNFTYWINQVSARHCTQRVSSEIYKWKCTAKQEKCILLRDILCVHLFFFLFFCNDDDHLDTYLFLDMQKLDGSTNYGTSLY